MLSIVVIQNNEKIIRVRTRDCACEGMEQTLNCSSSYDAGQYCSRIKYEDFPVSYSTEIKSTLKECDQVEGEIVEISESLKTFHVTKNISYEKRLNAPPVKPVETFEDKLAGLMSKYNNK